MLKIILIIFIFLNNVDGKNDGLLTFKVAARVKECFFEEINNKNKMIKLQYEVIEGGDLDIGISVISPTKHKILHKLSNFDVRRGGQNEPENINLINLEYGIYQICFDNIMASRDYKVIVIDTFNDIKEEKEEEEEGNNNNLAEKSEIQVLSQLAEKLENELEKLEGLQRYTQKRIHRHQYTQDSSNSRIDYLTMIQMGIIVFIVIGQTFYIKNWFKKKQISFRV